MLVAETPWLLDLYSDLFCSLEITRSLVYLLIILYYSSGRCRNICMDDDGLNRYTIIIVLLGVTTLLFVA